MAHPRYAFLINPASGSVSPGRIKALHAAITARRLDAEVILAGQDIEAQAARLRSAGYQAVIAGGGDGTLRAVASALAGTQTAFGVLPWGTFNHFAKDLNVPDDLDAIIDALETGQTHRIDTGEVNGRIFLNNAAVGIYPRFVEERDKLQRYLGKFPASGIVIAKLLLRYRSYHLKLTIGQQTTNLVTPLIFIGNNDYQIDRLGLAERTRLDAGKLCIYTLRSRRRRDMAKLLWRTLIGTSRNMELFEEFKPSQLTIDSPRTKTLLVALDGEVERMKLPLTIKLECRSLVLIDVAK